MSDADGTPVATNNPPGGESAAVQNNQTGYITSFPEDVRGHALLEGVGNSVELFTKARDLYDRYDGGSAQTIPGKNATQEEWSAFRNAMGVPKTKDGYAFQLPDDMDQNLVTGVADWIRDLAYDQGIPVAAAKAMFDKWVGDTRVSTKEAHEADVAATKEREKSLSEKYGEEWDKTKSSIDSFVTEQLGEETFSALSSSGALKNPVVLSGFLNLMDKVGEDKLPVNSAVGGNGRQNNQADRLKALFPNTVYPE